MRRWGVVNGDDGGVLFVRSVLRLLVSSSGLAPLLVQAVRHHLPTSLWAERSERRKEGLAC
jgi:hypothetical protein